MFRYKLISIGIKTNKDTIILITGDYYVQIIAYLGQVGVSIEFFGFVLRRIIGKAIMRIVKREMVVSTAPIQVCAGIPGGVEAAVHAVRQVFEDKNTEAIILVDADNAFNRLNRKATLHNIQQVCPEISTYVINTYRTPAQLYVSNCDQTVLSQEGVTQGDNTAMGTYSCGTMPLITTVAPEQPEGEHYSVKQVWYADDAAGGGQLDGLKQWWKKLCTSGPLFGYYPKPEKTWVIVKPGAFDKAKEYFPELNITTEGHRYLGSFVGSSSGKKNFIDSKVSEWIEEVKELSDIATREPQIAFAAFTYGLSKRWNYVCRTTPDISESLKRLEHSIKESFLPAIIDRAFGCDDKLREIFSLPARMGGLGVQNLAEISDAEYQYSRLVTKPLTEAIYEQASEYHENEEKLIEDKKEVSKARNDFYIEKKEVMMESLDEKQKLMIKLASEKGASSWLTALPLKEYGYILNRQEFTDAIAMRYNLKIKDVAKVCACGEMNSVDHALTCKKGGYVALRHNWLRDAIAKLLSSAKCKDVKIEPQLLPTNGKSLSSGSITADQARLDISARSVWNVCERAFFDVRVFNPLAPSNSNKQPSQMYTAHEAQKKRAYNDRVIQIEKGSFTPLVFSTSGGMGREAQGLMKKIAERMELTSGQRYSDCMGFMRKRLRFELLKTTLIALRGYRGREGYNLEECNSQFDGMDLNLEPVP